MALAAGGLGHAVQLRARCLPGRCSRYSRGAARRYGSIRGRRGDIRVQARADAELLLDLLLDLVGGVGVVAQEVAGILLALPELVALVGVPGPGLPHDPLLHAQVDEAAFPGDPGPVQDVELGDLERRADLVLHDLDAGPVA